jgi:hypothetical protein
LKGIHTTETAQAVIGLAHVLRTRIKQDADRLTAGNSYIEDRFGTVCDLLEAEDCRVIRELKLAIRKGVIVFEELEQDTIRQGSNQLLAVLQSIPSILEGFYNRLYPKLEL